MSTKTIDTAAIKQRINLIDLAERHSELRKESTLERSGPCPKCGGADRFHVSAEWFFCRQCHPTRGDAIEWVQWLDGLSFVEAVAQLTGDALPMPASKRKAAAPRRKAERSGWQQAKSEIIMAAAQDKLFAHEGEQGQEYLLGRKIEAHAWLTFGLGFVPMAPLPGTRGKQRAPAIAMPWYRGGKLAAVRYRFLQAQAYTDADGKERTAKQSALFGSDFSRLLYGGQALLGCAEDLRTLILCEGELNALSLWLVAHQSAVDVLSFGSESQSLTEKMVQHAAKYRTVILWADKPEVAKSAMRALQGAYAISSPQGQDANDLLKAGLLGGVLSTARLRACTTDAAREALLWDLWDAAKGLQGVDGGTASVLKRLADELGRPVQVSEVEPGRWLAS